MKKSISAFLLSIGGFAFGLIASLLLARMAGESPIQVLKIILNSAFGSKYDLGLTLFYTTHFFIYGFVSFYRFSIRIIQHWR
jgi:simple sugar transport system permease protein